MCVRFRRDYTLDQIAPASAGGFAAAAVLSALTPNDWRVSQDVELAVIELVASLKASTVAPSTTVSVEVTVHATRVDVAVGAETADWVNEIARIRPRRAFESHIACQLERQVTPPPRPALWPSLGNPRANRSWQDVYATLSRVTQTIRTGTESVGETLEAIAQGVVDATEFAVAAVNIVRPDGDFEVVAVAGDAEARAALLGVVESAEQWYAVMEQSEQWGSLRFSPGGEAQAADPLLKWVPPTVDGPAPADPWNAEDELYAPLYSGNVCIGIISVGLAGGLPRPGLEQLEKLELFAEHAALVIERSRNLNRQEMRPTPT